MSIALAIAVGLAYLAATVLYAKTYQGVAQDILRDLSVRCPDAWAEVGAPTTMQAAVVDPDRRWQRFIHEGAYRSRCDADLAKRIDEFRRGSLLVLASLSVLGIIVLYCLWQVEVPPASPQAPRPCVSVDRPACTDPL